MNAGEQQETKERLLQKIRERLEYAGLVPDEKLLEIIDEEIVEESRKQWIPLNERILLRVNLFNSLRKLDILQEYLDDPEVSEIMVNGYASIFLEKRGLLMPADKTFSSEEKLQDVIQQIVSRVNRSVNEASPIVDARLEDGSRVNVVLQAVALNGPILTIRKFHTVNMTPEQLVSQDFFTQEASDYLKRCIQERKNLFISGGTGTGKTTFLNVLSSWIPEQERIITIEDSAELKIHSVKNQVRLEARAGNAEGSKEISIRDLIKTALRMRPDRIIVGEVRDKACVDMLQAMNTGHDGSLSTGHGRSCADMLRRLETMAMMSGELPLSAIREQIGSAIDVMVHLSRRRDGKRQVETIQEVMGYEREKECYLVKVLFQRNEEGILESIGHIDHV